MRRVLLLLVFPLLACGPFFFQAPLSLEHYPERLPAKPWVDLFQEVAPLDAAARDADELDVTARGLVHQLAWLEPAGRLVAVDRALEENRRGAYSSRRADFLHELRELASGDEAVFKKAGDYLAWRVNSDAPMAPPPPVVRPWDMDEEHFKNLHTVHAMRVAERLEPMDRGVASGDAALLPNWLVQRGRFHFGLADYEKARADFEAVADRFPEHPRAEAAGIMLARCELEDARRVLRRARGNDPEAERQAFEKIAACERMLLEFIKRHPKGRFTPDAHGWLGAVACERGDLGLAVKHQIDRLEMQPTRETTRSVLRECDFLFARLFDRLAEEGEGPERDGYFNPDALFHADAVARHPVIARLFVQHALDPAAGVSLPLMGENFSGDRGTIDFLKRRILKPKPFVSVALAGLGRHMLVESGAKDPATLLVLAWASAEEGENTQALALLDMIPGEPGDEALHARATILQRMGRHADALAVLDDLGGKFPQSPLASDVRHRRAVALFHAGRAGDAWLEMMELYEEMLDPKSDSPFPNLHPDHHIVQWVDTLGRFAPLEQLVAARASLPGEHPNAEAMDHLIRLRAISVRDFELARRHMYTGDPGGGNVWPPGRYDMGAALHQTPEVWSARVEPLAELYGKLAASPSGGSHALHLAIARHWMEHRGYLTLPLLGMEDFSNSEPEKMDLLRRRNARFLGFSPDVVDRMLEDADEATHALKHALAAAESPDPGIAAPALELANHCLFRRTEFSLYQRTRAMETDAASLSRDIHRRLTGRFSASGEARRAVWYEFLPAAGSWMPGDYNAPNSHAAMLDAIDSSRADIGDRAKALEEIMGMARLFREQEPGVTLAGIRRAIDAARNRLDRLRIIAGSTADQSDILRVVDRLDDLAAAASLPGISAEDFTNYANHRTDELPPAFAAFLDYRSRLEMKRDDDGWEMGPRDDTVGGWRDYLTMYPDSPKAEAASFRMTRLIARGHRSRLRVEAFHFPHAPIPNGYKRTGVFRQDPTADAGQVLAAIGAHEAMFPQGRYRDDLDLLRAGALIDAGKPGEALPILHRILSSPVQGDLHAIAVLNYAAIAQDLLEPSTRLAALEAFRLTPRAMVWLERLAAGDTYLARVQPMLPWLREEVGKK